MDQKILRHGRLPLRCDVDNARIRHSRRYRLSEDIAVSGGKNAVLPIMAASVMAGSPCKLHNAPDLVDVRVMSEILRSLRATVEVNPRPIAVHRSLP